MTERVGFAGTGLMGRGMAKNILAAGFPLAVVAHHSRVPIEELVEQGATELPSYRQLAADSDLVFVCVTGTPEVESVVYQPERACRRRARGPDCGRLLDERALFEHAHCGHAGRARRVLR